MPAVAAAVTPAALAVLRSSRHATRGVAPGAAALAAHSLADRLIPQHQRAGLQLRVKGEWGEQSGISRRRCLLQRLKPNVQLAANVQLKAHMLERLNAYATNQADHHPGSHPGGKTHL